MTKAKIPTGRPLKHTLKEIEANIAAYFKRQDEEQRPYTVTGLANALNMDRDQLINYGNKEEFSNAIKEAKRKVHEYAEERLFGTSATGVIFSLKNNWGWKDKSEVENNAIVVHRLVSEKRAKEIAQEILKAHE